jgi:hypothetical protein
MLEKTLRLDPEREPLARLPEKASDAREDFARLPEREPGGGAASGSGSHLHEDKRCQSEETHK